MAEELNKETMVEQTSPVVVVAPAEGQPLAAEEGAPVSVPFGAPTIEEVNTTQVFRKQAVKLDPLPALKTAPRANPNPYTGLPVRKKGHVQTEPYD